MKLSRSDQFIISGVILAHIGIILLAAHNPDSTTESKTAIQATLIESKPQAQQEAPQPISNKAKKASKTINLEKSSVKTLAPEESKPSTDKSNNSPTNNAQSSPTSTASNSGVQTPASVELNQLVILYKPDTDVFYPSFSKRIGEEGNVEMRIQIDETGSVQNVQVVKSSNSPRLDKAATELALRIRFKPYIQNGSAIKVAAKFGVKFKLND